MRFTHLCTFYTAYTTLTSNAQMPVIDGFVDVNYRTALDIHIYSIQDDRLAEKLQTMIDQQEQRGISELETEFVSEELAIELKAELLSRSPDDQPMTEFNKNMAEAFRARAHQQGFPIKFRLEILSLLESLATRAFSRSSGMNLNCDSNGCEVPITLAGIWNYGCWCNFGENLMLGYGQPVNSHDEICKHMTECFRCAKLDGDVDGYTCDPKNKDYKAGFSWSVQNMLADCESKNSDDPCGVHVCTCEMKLIDDLLTLMWAGYVYQPEFLHENGFDPVLECELPPQSGNSGLLCCGGYPRRAPYNPLNRACCGDNLFNPLSHSCCVESVVNIGDVC